MFEGLAIAILVAYFGGWLILKAIYRYDERKAQQTRREREQRHMKLYGRVKSREEITDEARANVFPD